MPRNLRSKDRRGVGFVPGYERLEAIMLLSSYTVRKSNVGQTLTMNADGSFASGSGNDYLGAGTGSGTTTKGLFDFSFGSTTGQPPPNAVVTKAVLTFENVGNFGSAKDFAPENVSVYPVPSSDIRYYPESGYSYFAGDFFTVGKTALGSFQTDAATNQKSQSTDLYPVDVTDYVKDALAHPSDVPYIGFRLEATGPSSILMNDSSGGGPLLTVTYAIPPTLVIGAPRIDPQTNDLIVDYEVDNGPLSTSTTIDLYWAGGAAKSLGDRVASGSSGTYKSLLSFPVDGSIGPHQARFTRAQLAALGAPPAGATSLMAVGDPDHTATDPNVPIPVASIPDSQVFPSQPVQPTQPTQPDQPAPQTPPQSPAPQQSQDPAQALQQAQQAVQQQLDQLNQLAQQQNLRTLQQIQAQAQAIVRAQAKPAPKARALQKAIQQFQQQSAQQLPQLQQQYQQQATAILQQFQPQAQTAAGQQAQQQLQQHSAAILVQIQQKGQQQAAAILAQFQQQAALNRNDQLRPTRFAPVKPDYSAKNDPNIAFGNTFFNNILPVGFEAGTAITGAARLAATLSISALKLIAAELGGEVLGNVGTRVVEEGVAKSGKLNLVNTAELNVANASRIKPIPGLFDVVIHGTPNGVEINALSAGGKVLGDPLILTVDQLATIIKGSGYQAGQTIRLVSCNTGALPTGFAQQLATVLRQIVIAPTGIVRIMSDGSLVLLKRFIQRTPQIGAWVPGIWNAFGPLK